jgi:glycerophosphoryl diester phosphodiesterase
MISASSLIDSSRVLVIAHRGDSKVAPENTLPAFESAIDAAADFIELDYLHTADGVPVVYHDEYLDRTTDACQRWSGKQITFASKRWSELQQLDAGTWFDPRFVGTRLSSLEEVIVAITPRAPLMIERKSGDAATCVRILEKHGALDRVTVHAFDWDFLRDCHRQAPSLRLGALGKKRLRPEQIEAAKELGASIIGWEAKALEAADIAAIHAAGMKAWAWTVDDPDLARRLVAAGLDGLISNRPRAMRELLAT